MPFTVTEGVVIAPGKYPAVLESVAENSTEKFGGGKFRKWNFIADVAGVGTPISGTSSTNTSLNSKSYKWLTALLRRPLVVGEAIDDPVGQRVMLVIVTKENGFAKIADLEPIADAEQIIPGLPR